MERPTDIQKTGAEFEEICFLEDPTEIQKLNFKVRWYNQISDQVKYSNNAVMRTSEFL